MAKYKFCHDADEKLRGLNDELRADLNDELCGLNVLLLLYGLVRQIWVVLEFSNIRLNRQIKLNKNRTCFMKMCIITFHLRNENSSRFVDFYKILVVKLIFNEVYIFKKKLIKLIGIFLDK